MPVLGVFRRVLRGRLLSAGEQDHLRGGCSPPPCTQAGADEGAGPEAARRTARTETVRLAVADAQFHPPGTKSPSPTSAGWPLSTGWTPTPSGSQSPVRNRLVRPPGSHPRTTRRADRPRRSRPSRSLAGTARTRHRAGRCFRHAPQAGCHLCDARHRGGRVVRLLPDHTYVCLRHNT